MSLSAQEVSVARQGRPVLDRVSARIVPGRITAFLGPNGAGKSTLLQTLAGALVPHEGSVTLDGAMLGHLPADALARRRALLSQTPSVSAPFRVREVVALGRYPHRALARTGEDARAVAEALAEADMTAFAERPAHALSGGEAHRMHLARVLAQLAGPEADADRDAGPARYLLLDEPTSSLDLSHQHGLMQVLRGRAAGGWGIGLVVHDLNLALAYADEVHVLRGGRIAAAGPTAEVMRPEVLSPLFGVAFALSRCPASGRRALVSWPGG